MDGSRAWPWQELVPLRQYSATLLQGELLAVPHALQVSVTQLAGYPTYFPALTPGCPLPYGSGLPLDVGSWDPSPQSCARLRVEMLTGGRWADWVADVRPGTYPVPPCDMLRVGVELWVTPVGEASIFAALQTPFQIGASLRPCSSAMAMQPWQVTCLGTAPFTEPTGILDGGIGCPAPPQATEWTVGLEGVQGLGGATERMPAAGALAVVRPYTASFPGADVDAYPATHRWWPVAQPAQLCGFDSYLENATGETAVLYPWVRWRLGI